MQELSENQNWNRNGKEGWQSNKMNSIFGGRAPQNYSGCSSESVSLTKTGDFSNCWEAFQLDRFYKSCNGSYKYLEGDVIQDEQNSTCHVFKSFMVKFSCKMTDTFHDRHRK